MKTIHVIWSLLFLLITFSSCREITVTTKVNKNGSFTRIMTIRGDSSDLYKPGLPYPIDSSWESHIIPDTSEADKFILTYSKTYANNNLLNAEIENDTSWKKLLNRKIEIKKRFGLFYSYVSFRESYSAANPFTMADYSDFLSTDDLYYLDGNFIPINQADSFKIEQAEDKMEDYLLHSITLEFLTVLKEGIIGLKNPTTDTLDVEIYKDSLRVMVEKWSFNDPGEFISNFANWTGNRAYLQLNDIKPPIFEEQSQKYELIDNLVQMEGFEQQVEMPGLITSTNSVKIIGNQVSWHVDSDAFLFRDYEMTAESRVVNKFGFIATGVILLFFVLILFLKSKKSSPR